MVSFAYAVGRVRALEAKLLRVEQWDRLSTLPFEALLSALAPFGYAVSREDAPDFVLWFETEKENLINLCDYLLSGTDYPFFYKLPIDFVNLTLLARKEKGVYHQEFRFQKGGLLSEEDLRNLWTGRKLFLVPEVLVEGIGEAKKVLSSGSIFDFEFTLAGLIFRLWKEVAGESQVLQRLVNFLVDRINLHTFFTGGRLFLPGGNLSGEIYNQPREEIFSKIKFHYPWFEFLPLSPEKSGDDQNSLLPFFEKKNLFFGELKILEESKFIWFGPEPILNYYYQKSNELSRLRQVLSKSARGL